MFKIDELNLLSKSGEIFTYKFSNGINYFKGKNSSGKSEFYKFLDFMFGSSEDISKNRLYNDTIERASMLICVNGIKYSLTRTRDIDKNYLHYTAEEKFEIITLREYKNKLNSIFTKDDFMLKKIREFTNENLTFRTFTMFNFWGEKRQGLIQDFLDKCSDIKYSVKLSPLLNYIFNENLIKISKLQKELLELNENIKVLEKQSARYSFVCEQINKSLKILDADIVYNGKNSKKVQTVIEKIKLMQEMQRKNSSNNIVKLKVAFNKISEQIKVYENTISDVKQFEIEDQNRKILIGNLNELIEREHSFEYLVEPLKSIIDELDTTISFNNYVINDKTIKELKKQRSNLKNEIQSNNSKFEMYSLEEKQKAMAIVEEYLSTDIVFSDEKLSSMKKKLIELKNTIKILQNEDDYRKINQLSQYITDLYLSAKDISSLVDDDLKQNGFRIDYIKRGNILQPKVEETKNDGEYSENNFVNLYIGSMARHTLIQLCGYLGFMNLLLIENAYPIIPVLIIDHVSKPFDETNSKAIGTVINKVYETIDKDDLQIFLFDDEDPETLAIVPDHFENLVNDSKTGFNPFYFDVRD
ncbi:hypothetical protein [Carnobacterium divergens]|uniref:Rad50/SbcC-type AAA domain-containing protein n=1 Tax=Carnobacterium divergens DSM 20623 TaxID=1449336 RepID=A0A0R2HYC7_CARDV|nr:hypothetical protein [Carnobacterium divergens]KRN57775.1 hypothetical protein IV74_GL001030 [Carnobacterium divergens DSM 20623]MDO0874403.1 hypothetical protein [Carnobacterium divergens]SUX21816.1 Uncharacterised protein [Carnobacterium divergens]